MESKWLILGHLDSIIVVLCATLNKWSPSEINGVQVCLRVFNKWSPTGNKWSPSHAPGHARSTWTPFFRFWLLLREPKMESNWQVTPSKRSMRQGERHENCRQMQQERKIMTLIQAITRAQKLTESTSRQYVVLEEVFEHHKPSYHVVDGPDWLRAVERNPRRAERFRVVYPEGME